jgi:hypothetical protein
MPDLITGTQLQRDDLTGQNIIHKLNCVGDWACTVGFHSLTNEVEKCDHQDRERKVEPVFVALEYQIEVCNILDQEDKC